MAGPSVLPSSRPDLPRLGRQLLLGAVLVGLLALQFLSGHTAAGHHRVLPPLSADLSTAAVTAAAMQSNTDVPQAIAADASAGTGADGIGIVSGCALLLLAAVAVAVAVAVAAHRWARAHRPPPVTGRPGLLRGPPNTLPRLALRVERI